jgi:hypothetical protein
MLMSVFNTDSVTIIRRKGDQYYREQINTASVLPGAAQDRDSRVDERVSLRDGFEMLVSLVEKEDVIGEEEWSIMEEQRQLFIYEVIDSSVKLRNLNI